MPKYTSAYLGLDTGYGSDYKHVELNADSEPCVYLLYTPEQDQDKDPNLYLWVRRCSVFTKFESIFEHLRELNITIVHSESKHELFPELMTLTDIRGYKWYVEIAPIKT